MDYWDLSHTVLFVINMQLAHLRRDEQARVGPVHATNQQPKDANRTVRLLCEPQG